MTVLISIFTILFIHWVADFVLQTHWQATNKSKNNRALTAHVGTYTLTWFVAFGLIVVIPHNYFGIDTVPGATPANLKVLLFFPITFVAHWITDYFTSRWTSKLYAKGDYHNFFVVIGFDQLLHYAQLFLTIHFLT